MSSHSFLTSTLNPSSILLLACTVATGLLTLVVLVAGSVLICEMRKRRKESLQPVKVLYNAEGNEPVVQIVDEERGVRVRLPVLSQVRVPEEAMCLYEVGDSQGSYESDQIYANMCE